MRYTAKRNSTLPAFTVQRRADSPHPVSMSQLLFEGTLGRYLKERLWNPIVLNELDQKMLNLLFIEEQIDRFIKNKDSYRHDVVMKCAVLETWYQNLRDKAV